MPDSSNLWTGKASNYDRARPTPPPALLDLLTRQIDLPHPELVVDLGSGTGISTVVWGEWAGRVIGIEPNADIRREAERKAETFPFASRLEYREGFAHQTGLPDASADIVTAGQSFHWMEPTSTLGEVARILRPDGVFAAYDYDWPPAIHWELDRVVQEMGIRMVGLVRKQASGENFRIWPKDKHLENLKQSGYFRYTREVFLHHIEFGDETRFYEMVQSSAFNGQFKFSDEELGLDKLREAAHHFIGPKPVPWYVSYRVRLGIK